MAAEAGREGERARHHVHGHHSGKRSLPLSVSRAVENKPRHGKGRGGFPFVRALRTTRASHHVRACICSTSTSTVQQRIRTGEKVKAIPASRHSAGRRWTRRTPGTLGLNVPGASANGWRAGAARSRFILFYLSLFRPLLPRLGLGAWHHLDWTIRAVSMQVSYILNRLSCEYF
jgi:hypothetical protein